MRRPNFREEKKLRKKGLKFIAGIDEAGRGPLAGPVIAAATIVATAKTRNPKPETRKLLKEINDSKKLSPKKREEIFKIIEKNPSIKWGIGKVSERVIDRINIKNAAELAMEKAVVNLEKKIKRKIDFLIIDGNHLRNLKLKTYNLKLMPKADEKVFSCALSSIVAKVTRDKIMLEYHKKYPSYCFDRHKGYGTKLHFKLLRKYGPSVIHRQTFNPLRKMIKYNK